DKYVAEILKKFDFLNVKTASTPIETQNPLVKDEEADDVDVHLYRLHFVLDCDLSWIAFCLVEDFLLRFAKDRFCQTQNIVEFCLQILLRFASRILRFVSEALQFRDTPIQYLESVKKSIDERVQLKREYDSWVNERQMQTIEEKVGTSKALDASSVDTKA
nr:hypothetical protein [Tanacetum cinerariifolium]